MIGRREFNRLCAAFSVVPAAGSTMNVTSSGPAASAETVAKGPERKVRFPDGTVVPALGQGSAGSRKGEASAS